VGHFWMGLTLDCGPPTYISYETGAPSHLAGFFCLLSFFFWKCYCFVYFCCCCWDWVSLIFLPKQDSISASLAARITVVNHHTWSQCICYFSI
jgi:hypothetical protein